MNKTLKEHFAECFVDKLSHHEAPVLSGFEEIAYLAGFSKAIELAVYECKNHDSKPDPVLDARFRCNDLGCVAAIIKEIGNELIINDNPI